MRLLNRQFYIKFPIYQTVSGKFVDYSTQRHKDTKEHKDFLCETLCLCVFVLKNVFTGQ
jgi:hypothetical protein